MSSKNGHTGKSDKHSHGGHGDHGGHGHGSEVAEADIIKEKSPQDGLLLLAALAVLAGLLWYGFQWSSTAISSAETPGEGASHSTGSEGIR